MNVWGKVRMLFSVKVLRILMVQDEKLFLNKNDVVIRKLMIIILIRNDFKWREGNNKVCKSDKIKCGIDFFYG